MIDTPTPAPAPQRPSTIVVEGEVIPVIEDEVYALARKALGLFPMSATPIAAAGADDMTVLDVQAAMADYPGDDEMRCGCHNPADVVHNNNRRAAYAGSALTAYATITARSTEPVTDVITDLLTDLRHYADAVGVDLDRLVESSFANYTAELHNRS